MNVDLDNIITRARLAASGTNNQPAAPGDERLRLERIAAEFESMLMVQVLKDMRAAGKWDDGEGQGDAANTQSLFETLDVELASHLARAQGFGLKKELMAAFDRTQGVSRASAPSAVTIGNGSAAEVAPAVQVPEQPIPAAPAQSSNPAAPHVTSGFGWRRDPMTGRTQFHKGVDLRAAYGQEVQSAGAGRVIFSGEAGGYGTTVLIEHNDGSRTRYAHLSASLVQEGATVAAGQAVGRAGNSGRSTGAHLHFEVTDKDGRPLDPMTTKVS